MPMAIAITALVVSVVNVFVIRSHGKRYTALRKGAIALLGRMTVVENRMLNASTVSQRPFKAPTSWYRQVPAPESSPMAVKAENECTD